MAQVGDGPAINEGGDGDENQVPNQVANQAPYRVPNQAPNQVPNQVPTQVQNPLNPFWPMFQQHQKYSQGFS